MASAKFPPVTIIVLNWNGRSLLEACLTALSAQDYPDYTVTLVDNASGDDSVAFVRQRFPQVTVLESETNLGFAGGNNVALRRLETPFAVLVNPDIVVAPDWLRRLIAAMQQEPSAGIAGCKLYFPDGRINHAGGTITHPQAFPRHAGGHQPDQGQHATRAEVDYVIGAALAVRREFLNAVGLLDNGYFLYFEDADWCTRARRAGYRVLFVPEATAVHDESAVARKGSPAYLHRFHTGRWRYLLKHFAPQEIVDETLPAEAAWLQTCAAREREALAAAYRTTLARTPEIWRARSAHGAAPMPPTAQSAIVAGLEALRRQAVLPPADEAGWALLQERARVAERPFTSPTPLVGPLLARLRDAWANVAVRWYVRPLTQQQNAFNLALLEEVRAAEKQLRDEAEIWLAQDADAAALQRAQDELRHELARAEALVQRLEARLARLEQEKR